jgi:hypothetical protein
MTSSVVRGGTTTTKEKSAAANFISLNLCRPTTCTLCVRRSSLRYLCPRHSLRLTCLRRTAGLVAIRILYGCSRFYAGHFCCSRRENKNSLQINDTKKGHWRTTHIFLATSRYFNGRCYLSASIRVPASYGVINQCTPCPS